jgi:hypothetical protein
MFSLLLCMGKVNPQRKEASMITRPEAAGFGVDSVVAIYSGKAVATDLSSHTMNSYMPTSSNPGSHSRPAWKYKL